MLDSHSTHPGVRILRARRTVRRFFGLWLLLLLAGLTACALDCKQVEKPRGAGREPPGPQETGQQAGRGEAGEESEQTKEELRQGIAALKKGDFDQARLRFEKIPEDSAAYHRTLHNLALIHEAQGNPAKAEELLRLLVRREPANAEARADLGWILYLENDCEASIAESRAAFNLDNRLHVSLYNIGLCEAALGRADRAIAAYKEALDADKPAKGLKEALQDLSKHVHGHPKNPDALFVLAVLKGFTQDLKAQRALLVMFLDTDPPAELAVRAVDLLGQIDVLIEQETAGTQSASGSNNGEQASRNGP